MLCYGLSYEVSYAAVQWQTTYSSEVVARIGLNCIKQSVQELVHSAKQPTKVVVLPRGKDGVHAPVGEDTDDEVVSVVKSEVQSVGRSVRR